MSRSWQRALFLPLILLAWISVIVIVLWLLSHITKTLLVFGLSGIIAYALTPLVSLLKRWMPRGLAIAVAYVLGFGVLFGLLGVVVDTAANQVITLVDHLPNYQHQLVRFEPQLVTTFRALWTHTHKDQHIGATGDCLSARYWHHRGERFT